MGFRNEVFNSLDDVINRLCETICMVTNDMIKEKYYRTKVDL